MKKLNIFWVFIFISSMIFFSCSKSFLNEVPESSFSPQNTLKDSLGLEAAIAGLQASVREQYTTGTWQSLITCFQVGTDVAIGANIKGEEVPYYNYSTLNSQDVIASYFWTWAYKVINNANQIIQGVSDPSTPLSNSGRNGFLAEAKFYRAYAYNCLVTLYGAVPLVETPLNAPKTDFKRTSLDSLNNFITKDLIFSETNLPAITVVKKSGRISKEAAYQLLAEVYLRINKADLAELECLKVINSGMFSLIKTRYGIRKDQPGDPFSDMFVVGNQRRKQGNNEGIWVIEQEYNITGGSADGGDQHRRVWLNNYYQNTGMTVCDSLGGRGQARLRLSWWVINKLYTGTDMRNSRFNLRRNFWYNNPASSKFGQKVVPAASDTLAIFAPYTTKWNYTIPSNLSIAQVYKDLIMMRLGETYLLLAEAQFKQGKLTEAAASINVLRSRAQASQIQASDITLDFILDERARELIGEENRRMTLVRTGTLLDRVTKLNFATSSTIKDYNKLLPIPQSEIDLNKDSKFGQNPGY